MTELTLNKDARIGELTISVKDGAVTIKGEATITPEEWERISDHLDLTTGEAKHCPPVAMSIVANLVAQRYGELRTTYAIDNSRGWRRP